MTLRTAVESIYAALPRTPETSHLSHISPFIGAAFEIPAPAQLRVLGIGVNSYFSDEDVDACGPECFRGWAQNGKHRFFRGLRRECEALARGLIAMPGGAWNDSTYALPGSLYVTNAVKRFLPHASGRLAANVDDKWFSEGVDVWRHELQLLARHGALPHLIVVFGARSWWPTCQVLLELCDDVASVAFVRYRAMAADSELRHRLNVVQVAEQGATRSCFVVRLDHPTARRQWTATRMLANYEFQAAVVAANAST